MNRRRTFRPRLLAPLCGLAVVASVPVAAQGENLAMLGKLEPGEWTLRFRNGDAPRKLCLRTGRELIQLRHAGPRCSKVVVEDGASEVTVQYTCPGNGYGRTNIRRESATLVQVDSQGVAKGLPFQLTAEARRTGPCR